ncbi:MAG TPA: hypothetical protein VIX17_12585, partial [Pyrinomonadaceae bacterium]
RHCGEVVRDGMNGLVLAEVTTAKIAESLLRLVHDPQSLQEMADESCVPERCTLEALSSSLLNI